MTFAICKQCEHFHNKEYRSVRSDVWYNHLCLASPRPEVIDPYDGELKPCATNDIGRPIFTQDEFHFCRDINPAGLCSKFMRTQKEG